MAEKTKKNNLVDDEFKWPFGKKNYLVLALAVVVIVIGYITLGQGSLTLAPILLVLGYCVLIPIALIIRGRDEDRAATANSDRK
jgi:uncharacterized membrane protein HdeD (DUF308 family)